MSNVIRIGSALFNADHTQLANELRRVEQAGINFCHFDVFDGHFVGDLAFPPRTIQALRPLTKLPFEVHLAANTPQHFLPALAKSGTNLVFLPAESTPLLYETIFTARELGMQVGVCLALGTSLHVLDAVLPMLDAVLLLGRVTGEGQRGRTFNDLLLPRIRSVRQMIDAGGYNIDLQAAGGLETNDCKAAVEAGATSLPLGGALHREADIAAYVAHLRSQFSISSADQRNEAAEPVQAKSPPQISYRVLVASRSFGPNCPEAVERLRAAGCEIIANEPGRAPNEAEMLERIPDIDVLISGTEPVTAKVIAAANRLKVISKHGVGYENIDLAAARERGIPVAIASGTISDAVADMAMALLLALARQIPQGDSSVHRGEWRRIIGVELRGKTLGIAGLGQIGKGVCRRAKGFGMQVVAYDPYKDERFAQSWGVRYLSLDELFTVADFISLHTPVLPETRHMINATSLASMKPGAYLINTARGELVDEDALFVALSQGKLAGAATDVFQKEPPNRDHPLLSLENFIATPHSAGQTYEGLRKMGEMTVENILRVLGGESPLFSAQ